MFLAVCKNNLTTCAKGHVLAFTNGSTTSTAVVRCSNVWTGAAASWTQKTSLRTVRTEKKWFQRLKNSLCSLGQWPILMHFSPDKLRGRRSFNAGLMNGFDKGRCTSVLSTVVHSTPQERVCQTQERTNHYNNINSSAVRRSRRRNLSHVPLPLDFTSAFGVSHSFINTGVPHQQCRSYSDLSPEKPSPDREEGDSKPDSTRERDTPTQGDSPQGAKEGLFHFKELVSFPG
ncbi:hypothetical protein JZ751_003637 [Albula glossodonta]|uniref:Uncharacterized protein n=1 Tax=Albula glossodonta TaxID=121402 RepID=A0A8T2N5Z1_9TELE|nr:hypothetical protein JZ751_003637 [Albula glossodonta]